MKNIIAGILVVGGLVSMSAFAAPFSSGSTATAGAAGTCTLLANDVTLTLSNNVFGNYGCYVPNNEIKVATCHSAGTRKQETIQCAQTGTDADGNPEYNDDSCANADVGTTYTSTQFGKAFVVSTTGGSVAASSLSAYCTAGTVLNDAVAE